MKVFANFFYGKAAAIFVFLAGVGLALMTNSAIQTQDLEKQRIGRKKIFKKAIFLFIVGLSYVPIWPADILHYYGIYMLLMLLFIYRSPKQILLAGTSLILTYPVLMLFLDYEKGWIFELFEIFEIF